MVLHFLAGVIFFYLLLRFVLPLSISRKAKVVSGAGLLIVSQPHLVMRFFYGGLASPELPANVLLIIVSVFAAVLFFFLLVLLRDLASLFRRFARRGARQVNPPFSRDRRQVMLAGAAAVVSVYGVGQGVDLPEVRQWEVSLPKLPPDLDGLRLVQISDLHVSSLLREAWVQGVVKRVNALKPDLILFTGDSVDGLPVHRAAGIAPLADLRARYGVFGCTGNHEYYGDFRAWMATFPTLGITMLQNAHRVVHIEGQALVIAGVTDQVASRFALPMPDSRAALAGAPENVVRIMLAHRPTEAKASVGMGVDLQLSGHTHGGQILGMNKIVARFNQEYLYGWYHVDAMPLYVCSGAGLWNGFPVRLGVPSEIAHIVLRSPRA